MLKYNLIFLKLEHHETHYAFLDTGGGMTFLFREPELADDLRLKYRKEKSLAYMPKSVIAFFGHDWFAGSTKIFLFDYINKMFKHLEKIPKGLGAKDSYQMLNKRGFPILIADILINGKSQCENFLFDTGATQMKNGKPSATSFLDGKIFDTISEKKSYHEDDGSPSMMLTIRVFGKVLRAKFTRRPKGALTDWMSKIAGVDHVGAIGGNILKHFTVIADYGNKRFYATSKVSLKK